MDHVTLDLLEGCLTSWPPTDLHALIMPSQCSTSRDRTYDGINTHMYLSGVQEDVLKWGAPPGSNKCFVFYQSSHVWLSQKLWGGGGAPAPRAPRAPPAPPIPTPL